MSLLWISSRSVRVARGFPMSSSMLLTHFCALHRPLECAAASGAMLPQGQAEQHARHAHEFQCRRRRHWSRRRAGGVYRLGYGSRVDSAGGRRKCFASGVVTTVSKPPFPSSHAERWRQGLWEAQASSSVKGHTPQEHLRPSLWSATTTTTATTSPATAADAG